VSVLRYPVTIDAIESLVLMPARAPQGAVPAQRPA
jgi:hypothetical protein